jgi:hypothetical protein
MSSTPAIVNNPTRTPGNLGKILKTSMIDLLSSA